MLLLLIRHADAGDRDSNLWPDDTERPITKRGRRQTTRMAKRLRRRGYVPTLLLTSPWTRAWQTAELIAQEFEDEALNATRCEALATMPRLEPIADSIGVPGDQAIVALVGHEPWIGELGSRLLTSGPSRLQFDFPKSGVLAVDLKRVEGGSGSLVFFWRPKKE